MNTRTDATEGSLPADRLGPGPQLAAWAAGLGLLLVGAWLFLTPHAWATLYQRDLPAYQGAIDAFAAGHDPYQPAQVRHAHGLPFIAPPFVWLLYKLAAHSPLRPMFGSVLMTVDIVSVVALPVILSRLFLGPGAGRTVLGAGFFFTAFLGSGVFTALVVNNGTPLYALIALGLIDAVRRGRWLGFHLAVALATAFKPFYAAFWLVPLLADAESRRQWAAGALAVGAGAASYVLPLLLAPRLMAAWLHTLVTQVVDHDRLGDNLLGAMTAEPLARHVPPWASSWAPYAAHLALSAVLVGGSLLLGRLDRTQRIAGLLLAAVFLNPRAMRYDLSMATIPLLAVVAGAVSRGPPEDFPSGTVQAASAVILAGVMIVFSQDKPADGLLYAGIAVAALLGAILASRHASPAPNS
ncbi:MAG TPA: hypothetical protein VF459_17095 [Caulobacteraceae bacterium]